MAGGPALRFQVPSPCDLPRIPDLPGAALRKESMAYLRKSLIILLFVAVSVVISRHNYLLFHSLAEIFSIVIAFGIFVIGWNSRSNFKNNYLLFIGIAYLFVAFFDTLHTLAYKGMPVFAGFDDNNLPPQLWLVARYMESLALLAAPFFFDREFRHRLVIAGFTALSALAFYAIFFARIFPVCFITGSGLTPFKVASEYLIDVILLAALYLLHRRKEQFEPDVLRLLTLSIICTMVTELCFTIYVHLYGISNLVGHFFKIFSFYFMYRAIIVTALTRPYDLLFTRLHRSEEKFRGIVESSPLPMCFYRLEPDGSLVLTGTNPAADRIVGAPGHTLVGKEISEAFPGYRGSDIIETYRKVARGEVGQQTFEFPYRDDRFSGVLSVHVYRIPPDGIAIDFEDITWRKNLEEERLEIERRLLTSQKLESLGQLAGGIAHEFNNILTIILGSAEIVRHQPEVSPVTAGLLQGVEEATLRGADLARQMLAYSGKGRFIVRPTDLTTLVGEISELLRTSVPGKAELRFELSRQLPPVEADASQLRQLVMNLFINACEAVGEQPGTITVRTAVSEYDAGRLGALGLGGQIPPGRYVSLDVADTGCGMGNNVLARIYDPFFSTKFTGRGMGMAAVQGIVRGHGGGIHVESREGSGTLVRVLFPLAGREYAPEPRQTVDDPEWCGSGTVLLVDDERQVLEICRAMLESLGFTVITAGSGADALRTQRERGGIDLVILDLTMPRMSGEETFHELRRIDPQLTVIISSGYNEQDVAQRFAGTGVAGVLHKPYTCAQLRLCLREALAGSGA